MKKRVWISEKRAGESLMTTLAQLHNNASEIGARCEPGTKAHEVCQGLAAAADGIAELYDGRSHIFIVVASQPALPWEDENDDRYADDD